MLVSAEILEMASRENKRYYQELKQTQVQLDKAKEKHFKKMEELYLRYENAKKAEVNFAHATIGIFDRFLPVSTLDYFSEREICFKVGATEFEFLLETGLLECCGVDCEGLRLYTPVWR